jgi:3-oxoacyl-[acyl-carrier-protein] synthase II
MWMMKSNSNHTDYQALMKKALVELREMKAKLKSLEDAIREPIAIVGMGCRFPGASNPEEFWQLLSLGIDPISEIPRERWDVEAYYHPNPDTPGKMCTRHGGFVNHLDEFDANFFNLSPREAVSLDPQQRLLLEVTWEALEHAAISLHTLIGTQTGVFVGICAQDYLQRFILRDLTEIDIYVGTGNTHSVAAGRLSYWLGLVGPSLAVDTACSSSLVTVHLACQSLRNRDSDLALAGGVNHILSPETTINFSQARMLSPDGRCKAFDASANGYVRSEGCGIVVLKRLEDAIADGNNILAVIRGSAINQDGRTSGLTVPNGFSQQALLRRALSNAGVEPSQVSYVEAHGTGTALGDPIEVGALGAVFSKGHSKDNPLMIGSVKTNIGHAEGAAGIAGLIKVVLGLQHQEIPPNLHLLKLNPNINWDEYSIVVPTSRTPWCFGEKPRKAGVSSFSFSGTNAHVVLEEAPPAPPAPPTSSAWERPQHLLTLSAKTQAALEQLVVCYQQHIQAHPEQSLADICFTTNIGRTHFPHRLAVVAASTAEVCARLAAFTAKQEAEGVFVGDCLETEVERVGLLPRLQLGVEDWQQMLHSLGELYVRGVAIDWVAFHRDYNCRRVVLPTYPFQRQRYWVENPAIDIYKRVQCEALVRRTDKSWYDWLYQVEWRPYGRLGTNQLPKDDSLSPQESQQSKNWLIMADNYGIGQRLATQLQSQGQVCTLVLRGDGYKQLTATEFRINPTNPEDFKQLLMAVKANLPPLHAVVNCWSLDSVRAQALTKDNLPTALQLVCGSTLHLVQAIVQVGFSESPRLWLVTKGAQAVSFKNSQIPGIVQSSLWGMGKVIALEHPELNCVQVDLDPHPQEDEVQDLFLEIWLEDTENQVAFRNQVRYVARLVRRQKTPDSIIFQKNSQLPQALRQDSTYLITGGMGALGLLVARWMVNNGARHLVLVGRSGATESISAQLKELEDVGARVVVATADVSDIEQTSRVLSEIQQSLPPLRGIIHSAGVLDDGILIQQNWERFAKVMAPKVQGAWNLHTLTINLPLDFFVLFSSTASLLGSPAQANYAAANAFLDALAYYRRCFGLPGLSINWGAVSEVGVAAERDVGERLQTLGIGTIAPQQVLEVLEEDLFNAFPIQFGIIPINWFEFDEQLANWSFLNDFQQEFGRLAQQHSRQGIQQEFLEQLKNAAVSERFALLITHVRSHVAKVIRLGSTEQLNVHKPLNNMGLDSLMALELRNWVQTNFGVDIPMVKIMEGLSVASITSYVSEQLTEVKPTTDTSVELTETSHLDTWIEGKL